MDHRDHVALIQGGVRDGGTTWADLGSGEGAFTLALAEVLGPGGVIHSVDRDARALAVQADRVHAEFPEVRLVQRVADFVGPLELPLLDGIVMANSLHFVDDKAPLLRRLAAHVRPGGRVVLVEYNADAGNRWVPYPISFRTWAVLAERAGLADTRLLAEVPSRFLGSVYAALSLITAEHPA